MPGMEYLIVWLAAFHHAFMERYRSGHNGTDSKSCGSGGRPAAESVGITGFLEISTLFNGFISTDFLRFFYVFYAGPEHWGGRAKRWESSMERYRSGHNGTDSKSVDGQPSVGSNPTRSATGTTASDRRSPFLPCGDFLALKHPAHRRRGLLLGREVQMGVDVGGGGEGAVP